jgi:hypothetical protein
MNGWLLVAVASAAVLLVTGALIVREHCWLSRSQIASGTVIDLQEVRVRGTTRHAPHVQFTTGDGITRICTGGAFSEEEFHIGDVLLVAYRTPSDARIVSFQQRFALKVQLASIAIGLLVMAVLSLLGPRYVPSIYIR